MRGGGVWMKLPPTQLLEYRQFHREEWNSPRVKFPRFWNTSDFWNSKNSRKFWIKVKLPLFQNSRGLNCAQNGWTPKIGCIFGQKWNPAKLKFPRFWNSSEFWNGITAGISQSVTLLRSDSVSCLQTVWPRVMKLPLLEIPAVLKYSWILEFQK